MKVWEQRRFDLSSNSVKFVLFRHSRAGGQLTLITGVAPSIVSYQILYDGQRSRDEGPGAEDYRPKAIQPVLTSARGGRYFRVVQSLFQNCPLLRTVSNTNIWISIVFTTTFAVSFLP